MAEREGSVRAPESDGGAVAYHSWQCRAYLPFPEDEVIVNIQVRKDEDEYYMEFTVPDWRPEGAERVPKEVLKNLELALMIYAQAVEAAE